MIDIRTDKLLDYELIGIIKRDQNGTLYDAIEGKSNKRVLLSVIDYDATTSAMHYSNNTLMDFQADHEIIISNPPCPASLDQTKTRDFPVSIDGRLFGFHLSPGVRKPGYWATTAVRVARKYMNRMNKDHFRILDLGCGCGVVGILLGLDPKVGHVVFSDINEKAINSTVINAKRMKISNYETYTCDLFEGIAHHNTFDLIVFGPPFYPDIIPTDYKTADIGGPRGTEIAERYVNSVTDYLSPGGYSITYLADFVEYHKITHALYNSKLVTIIEDRDILYPFRPGHGFPQCNEIVWRNELESFYNYSFKEYMLCNRRFIGFKMLHFISQLNNITHCIETEG